MFNKKFLNTGFSPSVSKANKSDRRTEGYGLVLVTAQRVWVINNKGGKGEGRSEITWGPEDNDNKITNLIFSFKIPRIIKPRTHTHHTSSIDI